MSDLHPMPLRGHDLPPRVAVVRGKVFKRGKYWYWGYAGSTNPFWHGPFTTWGEAFNSAWHTVEAL